MLFTSRPRFTPLCLLLFSDLLLITQPKRWVLRGRGASPSKSEEEASSGTHLLSSERPLPWVVGSGCRFWTMPIAPWCRPSRFLTHLDPLHFVSLF